MERSTPDVSAYFSSTKIMADVNGNAEMTDATPIPAPVAPAAPRIEFNANYVYCPICIRYFLDYPPVVERMENGMSRVPLCMCDTCRQRNGF